MKINIKYKLFAALIVAAVAVAGFSGPMASAHRGRNDQGAIKWGNCPVYNPEKRLKCGTLQVPLDYKNPTGKTITIAVSKLEATKPSLRQGVLLLNPGGPGGPGLDMPLWMSQIMPKSVVERYDLIGFDPRGVAFSAPVTCGLNAVEGSQIAPPMEQPGGFYETAFFMARAAVGCALHSGKSLPHMTTANTARDMDRIRQSLGERKISYFGYSYGSYLGAVYATLFPQNTQRFVLDSATTYKGEWREVFRSWGLADEARFPDLAQYLIDHKDQYNFGSTQKEVRETFFRLLNKLEKNPITTEFGDFTAAMFRVYTFSGLYSDDYFEDTALIWQFVDEQPITSATASLEKAVRLKTEFPRVPQDNSGASANAVLCDDFAWPRSIEQYRKELQADTQRYPMFGSIGSHIWPCAFWPTQPIEPPVVASKNGPSRKIMIVQNTKDPATPYRYGQEMRAALGDRARLVTVEQGGHGASYGAINACAQDVVTKYLIGGALPGDTTCTEEYSVFAKKTDAARNAMRELHRRMW
ncbi:MAG TPA: alpha/beta hydrolase [Candidatus Saccharimonadales bacterium]